MSASRNPFAPNQNVAIRLGAEATAIEANRRRTDNDARTNGQRVNGDTQINGQQTNGGTQANDYDTNGAPQPQSEIPATRTPENTLRIEGRLRELVDLINTNHPQDRIEEELVEELRPGRYAGSLEITLRNGYGEDGEMNTEAASLTQLEERLGDGRRRAERMGMMWDNGWTARRADPRSY